MLKVLFLCTGNSCRSQMAEGRGRRLKGDVIPAYSAGVATHGMNPHAVAVVAEAGVDITSQRSKHVDELADVEFDYVVTVCDNAAEVSKIAKRPRPASVCWRALLESRRVVQPESVEAAGIEPASRDVSEEPSTCVVDN